MENTTTQDFLDNLTELMLVYGIGFSSCGCCSGHYLVRLKDFASVKYQIDHLEKNLEEYPLAEMKPYPTLKEALEKYKVGHGQ